MLLQKSIDLQSDQLPKPQLQNRICLPGGKGKLCCHHSGFSCLEADSIRNPFDKAFLCLLRGIRPANDLDDEVNDIAGLDETFLNLALFLLLGEHGLIFPSGDLKGKINISLQNLLQGEGFRTAVLDGEHVDAERIFQLGFLVQKSLEVLHIGVLLQLNDNPDSFLGRLIRNIYDIVGNLILIQRCNILQELGNSGSDHRVWNFCHNKIQVSGFSLFRLHSAAKTYFALSGFVNGAQLFLIDDNSARRKIRSLDIAHQVPHGCLRVLQQSNLCINDLRGIVRRR